jgi:hypothetical protein
MSAMALDRKNSLAQVNFGRLRYPTGDPPFERLDKARFSLRWVPSGHLPTATEAKEHFEYLVAHGPSAHAFGSDVRTAQSWKTARFAPGRQTA